MYRKMNAIGLAWSAGMGLLMIPTGRTKIMAWIVSRVSELGWLNISYIMLWGLTLIPALLLHRVLREAMWLSLEAARRTLSNDPGTWWPRRDPVPQFSAPVLGADKVVTSNEIIGEEAMLMFVRPEDGAEVLDKQLRTSVHGLFHKAKGNLFVVCSGSSDGCGRLLPEMQLGANGTPRIAMLLDEDGGIAGAFHVKHTPVVFRLDSEARVVGFGRQR